MERNSRYDYLREKIRARVDWISESDLSDIIGCLTEHTLSARQFIIQAGERVRHLHYVVSGLVRAFYVDDAGNEITVNFMEEGRLFTDYLSTTRSLPSRFYFQAIEPVGYLSLPIEVLDRLCDRSHAVERFYRLALGEIFTDWERRTESFLFLKAEDRYRRFLSEKSNIASRVSVTDLSSYLGIERQSLTRIRKKIFARQMMIMTQMCQSRVKG